MSYALAKAMSFPGRPEIEDFKENVPFLVRAFQLRGLVKVNAADKSAACQEWLGSVALVKGVAHIVKSDKLFVRVPLSKFKAHQRHVEDSSVPPL